VNQPNAARKRVVVIGGGITGLAAAHRVVELDPAVEVVLLEAGERLGGVLETVRRDGFLIERSADSFITEVPWAVDLCRRIGFADQLIPTASGERNAMVVHRGRLERIPPGFMLLAPSRIWPLVTTPILSPWGKIRLLGEVLVPRRRADSDESLGSFARRRLGRETFERIVQPLVGGIYTADAEQLSLKATLPRFVEMERRYGSLILGGLRERRAAQEGASDSASGARYGLFVTPRDGLTSLVEAIARRLPEGSIRLNTPVDRIERDPNGSWQVRVDAQHHSPASIACQGVIVAVGADRAARLLATLDGELAGDLRSIPSAGTAIVTLAFRRDQISHSLDTFGFVVPAIENRRILAGSFSSVKFPGRAPQGEVLVRVFIGGACQGALAELGDDELRTIATEELRILLGTRGDAIFCDVARWPRSMPQYHLGHCELVGAIERETARWPGLALAGNAYHGVGIPNCIRSGEEAAERICAALKSA
jgi:protoporphyrinogen/coproporphyrinogen III oxidase